MTGKHGALFSVTWYCCDQSINLTVFTNVYSIRFC